MNKKQLIVLWITVIMIIFFLGLRTTTIYRLSEVTKPDGPEFGHTALKLYGSLLLSSNNAGKLHFLLDFGNYKYQLILACILVGGTLLYSLKSKENKKCKA